MADTTDAFVALGSNLDEPRRQVLRAIDALAGLPGTSLSARSRLYTSPPMDGTPQPDYVNAVAWLRTTLAPRALLDSLLGIEQAHGRSRGRRWAARTLDLDLLLYGGEIIDEPGLRIPHPGLTTRAFVLYPLAELVPQMEIPGAGPLPALCARVPADGLAVIED
jgi:2-amino-4-hydroxy-6-hydroxymethyldihydropteridine diphosphokinase